MIYLASPYSHPEASVREYRFQEICRIAAGLIQAGELLFCPIAHSHPIAVHGKLPENNSDYWSELNRHWIRACSELRIAKLEGWESSIGVQREIRYANALGIPVSFMEEV